ncbi:MAG: lysophospholipid acyltransferase family protein [Candidatus Promineifilaceae bacterium]
MQNFFLNFLRLIVKLVVYLFFGTYKVVGYENCPAKGPYILVTNHMSAADVPVLLISFPGLAPRFFAGEKWESHWFFGPLMKWGGAIYIKRGEVDRKALKEGLEAIEQGAVFGLAPEGTRSRVRQMLRGRDGAAYLASKANVPILPVGLVNTDVVFANARHLRRTRLECHIGKPFMLPDLGHRPKSYELSAYTHLIMVQIAALLPERYYGYYADSPALAALLRGEDAWPYCLEAERNKPEERLRGVSEWQ